MDMVFALGQAVEEVVQVGLTHCGIGKIFAALEEGTRLHIPEGKTGLVSPEPRSMPYSEVDEKFP
jgi:hypothetical protein